MRKKGEDITISSEIDRLSKIFKNISEDKAGLVKELIQNAAYSAVTLRELQKNITEMGAVMEYNNGGGQKGIRISPALQAYNKLLATYNTTVKQLVGLLPKSEQELARLSSNPLTEFLMDR